MPEESENITFEDDKGEEHTIDKKNFIAAGFVPSASHGGYELVGFVEPSNGDTAAPPVVKWLRRETSTSNFKRFSKPDVDEVHSIISTASGGNQASQFYNDSVMDTCMAVYDMKSGPLPQGPTIHHHETKSETSILELANDIFLPSANDGKRLRIILLSGDGGIVDLVNGLQSQPLSPNYVPPELIIMPLGTANALYHSIYGGRDNTWGLKALASTKFAPLPTFTVSFSPGARLLIDEARQEKELPKDESGTPILHGAVVCSWGMHATLVADSDSAEYRKFGIDRFKMAAKEALYPADGSLPHGYRAKVSVLKPGDGEWKPLDAEKHLYVLATMVSNLEKTFIISPSSKTLDGSLRLVHFGPTSGDEAMRIMNMAYDGGKHVEDEKVLYEVIDGIRIQFEGGEEEARWRRICVDGKIVRVEKDGWVEMRKQTRHVLSVATI